METLKKLSQERSLFLAMATLVGIYFFEASLADSVAGNLTGFLLLFGVIIYTSLSVAHHAELLAYKFGEPYGTLILTLSAVLVEIVIIVMMMLHQESPTLARDTIYSAIMLDINGLLGLAAIIGGLRYGEQPYNIDSSNSYLSMLLVAIGVAMVLPHFIDSTHQVAFMLFNVLIFLLLYGVFTKVQLSSHKYFFEHTQEVCDEGECEDEAESISALYHSTQLVISIILIGILAEVLSGFMEHTLRHFSLPLAMGAVSVAVISAAPELITAIRAAMENRMQTVINIALGASLATILLTIPAVIVVSLLLEMPLTLALTPLQGVMLGLTLLVSIVNFNDGETNMLEGFLHVVLFIVFCFVLFL